MHRALLIRLRLTKILFFVFCISNSQEISQIDNTVKTFMHKWEIPGLSISIVNKGHLIYAKGYGYANIDDREKVTPRHKFRLASVSKPITSVMIFKLVEEGKLNLSDKVFGKKGILNDSIYSKILDKRILKINIGQLLEHTGGWDRHKSFDPMFRTQSVSSYLNLKRSPTASDVISFMLQTKYLDHSPGIKYAYSNFGYCILGRVIEKLTGLKYEESVKDKILNPLEMHDTKLGVSTKSIQGEVTYYSDKNKNYTSAFYPFKQKVLSQYGGFDLSIMDSHGGWISSTIDMVKFICSIDGYQNKKDIISKKSLKKMFSKSLDSSNYAKGWSINNSKNCWHMGSLPGTYSMIARIHDGKGWVILMNKKISNNIKFGKDVDKLIWKAIRGINLSKLPEILIEEKSW